MPRPWRLLLLGLALALSAAPVQGGHEPGEVEPQCTDEVFFHLCLDVQDLGPGEEKRRQLMSPEGPLRAGWVYILYGGVVEGNTTAVARLEGPDGTNTTFDWAPGLHKDVTKIQATGNHTLVIHNPANETIKYAFYYDQSCNCDGKVIPLTGGFVLFNYEFQGGRQVDISYPLTADWHVRGRLAAYDPAQPTADWPDDFEILQTVEVQAPQWLNFTFVPPERAVYYVFIEDLGTAPRHEAPIQLSPIIEVEEDEVDAEASGALMPILVGTLVLAAGLVGRRP